MSRPTVISLFTGAGGLDLGFDAAGLATAVAVEMDADSCRTLRANQPRGYPWEVIEAPVETVSTAEILRAARLDVGEADLLIGGPPCQPFSKSGYWSRGRSGRLDDPRANTLWEYLRVLRETQPKAFLIENVSGLAYTGKEEGLALILDEVDRINAETGSNYAVAVTILNAADFGVPQKRERMILVGDRSGRRFEFPEPRFFDGTQTDSPTLERGESYRTAWDALGNSRDVDDLQETTLRGRWAELLPSIPEGANYLHHTSRGAGRPLFGWRRRYWSFLLKLAKALPAWTLTAQPGPAIGPFHWKNRRLARMELLRLQTFPEGYSVCGSLSDAQRQLGNAVPSLLAEVLALEIRRQILGHRVSSKHPKLVPPKRPRVPNPEPVAKVPAKYLALVGDHESHPGTGLGYGAMRRAAR